VSVSVISCSDDGRLFQALRLASMKQSAATLDVFNTRCRTFHRVFKN